MTTYLQRAGSGLAVLTCLSVVAWADVASAGAGGEVDPARIRFIEPVDGDEVEPQFRAEFVGFDTSDETIGSMELRVDGGESEPPGCDGAGRCGFPLELSPGAHTLTVNAFIESGSTTRSASITVTVVEGDSGSDGAGAGCGCARGFPGGFAWLWAVVVLVRRRHHRPPR